MKNRPRIQQIGRLGRIAGQTLPGGNSRQYGYDPLMNLITNVALDSAQNTMMFRAYSRNIAGNISGQQTESGSISYGYDQIDQLVAVTNSALGNEWYSYDAMGNRLTSSNTILSATNVSLYSANSLNQYSEITNNESQVTLQYDLNGNLTNQTSATEANVFTWDIENRLVEYQKTATNGLTSAQYTYDPFGRRLSKAVNGVTNYFLYSDEGLIGEYDAAGNETASYGYAPNSLWGNNALWMRTFVPSLNGGETNYLYYLNDHLGAPQRLVRKNGAIAWGANIDSFGNAHLWPGNIVTNNLRFSSQYYDEESGLHYNTMRYYDPVSGRYLARDPIDALIYNLYTFVDNDPTDYVDTDGRTKYKPGDEGTGGAGTGGGKNDGGSGRKDRANGGSRRSGLFGGGLADATLGAIILSGTSDITCCDANNKRWKAKYTKVCIGLAIELSVVFGGQIGVAGANCPQGYKGGSWEFHGGFGLIAAGGGISSSGTVGGVGVGIGFGGGIMWCEYEFNSAQKIGCCP